MPYNFIYVDDTFSQLEEGTINGLQDGGEIKINFKKPVAWETLINEIVDQMPSQNGIILDLRLNVIAYAPESYAKYRGSTLAQELRTLSKEDSSKNDYPIILISADENIQLSLDQTSYDLFDYVVSKNILGNDKALSYAYLKQKLIWLADGYTYLNSHSKSIDTVLNNKELSQLDSRFIDAYNQISDKPNHVIARFITKNLIERPSFLINEDYLSTRLGIDKRSPDWNKLLNTFIPDNARYSGAFSNFYNRWWMPVIQDFWTNCVSADFSIRNTNAHKKVELIIEKSGFEELKAIEKASKSKSENFWVNCKATNIPIDTIDGFALTANENRFAWQEPEYVSIEEALRPTKGYNISSIEKPRLQKLKEFFEQHEQRIRK
jgi:hypothetical protein